MKRFMIIALAVSFGSVFAAGWTPPVSIVNTNFQQYRGDAGSNLFNIATSGLTKISNPASCDTDDGANVFIVGLLDTEKQKNFEKVLIAAQLADKKVRLYVLDNCPIWGAAVIDGVEIESN